MVDIGALGPSGSDYTAKSWRPAELHVAAHLRFSALRGSTAGWMHHHQIILLFRHQSLCQVMDVVGPLFRELIEKNSRLQAGYVRGVVAMFAWVSNFIS